MLTRVERRARQLDHPHQDGSSSSSCVRGELSRARISRSFCVPCRPGYSEETIGSSMYTPDWIFKTHFCHHGLLSCSAISSRMACYKKELTAYGCQSVFFW